MVAAAKYSGETPANDSEEIRALCNGEVSPGMDTITSIAAAEVPQSGDVEMKKGTQVPTSSTLPTVGLEEEARVQQNHGSSKSASSVAFNKAPPPRQVSNGNGAEKNPLQMFNDYVANLFQKAEVYEQELERREESKTDLQESLDDARHGNAAVDENGIAKNNKTESTSPRLSPTSQAVAAVEAMSSFRSFTDVKREVSFRSESDKESKRLKSSDSTQADDDVVIAAAEDIKDQWAKFCEIKKQNAFGEVVIESIALNMTVDELHDLILKDNAPNSVGKFMTQNGDFDVETTPWEPSDGQPMTRTIHYTHPVNVPMAPPSAKAFKTQYLHRFGALGLCLESSTIVQDVPMTDCFVVDDRLWICQDHNGCTVRATFQIRFVKTTMFRRIIESATRTEFEKWWTRFGEMMMELQCSDCVSIDDDDFELVAKKLEEITQMLECEVQDMVLPDTLKKIRSSSMRLSVVAKRASMRRASKTAPKSGNINMALFASNAYRFAVSLVEKSASALKDESQSGNVLLSFFVILFSLSLLNLFTYRQVLAANETLLALAEQMKELSAANKIMVSALESTTCVK
ncbi:hypothetical protein ACHAXN_006435 [Cyclotella atomus]